jgi:hexosaminidase
MTYPRALAIAEMLWSPKHKRNWQDFVNRLETQFERLDAAEVNYARSMYDPIFKVSKNDKGNLVIELSTEVDGLELYYSMDNTFPDKYSPRYTQPLEMPQGTALLRLITYRNGKPVGKMISAKVMDLEKRVKK